VSLQKRMSSHSLNRFQELTGRGVVLRKAPAELALFFVLAIVCCLFVQEALGQQEELFFPFRLHLTDNPRVHHAGRLIDQGKYEEALEILEKVLETNPKDSFARELLREAYLNLKEYEKLELFLKEELRKNPGSAQLLSELADLYFKQERTKEGRALLEGALRSKPREINTYRVVAETYARNRKFSEAIETYRLARKNIKKPYAFAFEIAGMYENMGEWKEASQEYLLHLRGNPQKLRSVSLRLSSIIQTGADQGEIKSAISSAIRRSPKDVTLYRLYGEILLGAGEFDQALEHYKICELLSERKSTPLLDFSSKCLEYKAYRTAREAIKYLFDKKPPSGPSRHRALVNMAKAYQGLGQSQRAIETYREVVESKAHLKLKAEASFAVAEIELYELNDPERALEDFQKVIRDYPLGSYRLQSKLRSADCLLMMNELERASELYEEVASRREMSPAVEEARLRRGDLELYSGNYQDAKRIYGRLIRDFPKGFFINDCLERQFLLIELQDTSSSQLIPLANLFLLEAQRKFDQVLAHIESLDYSQNPFLRDMLLYRRASTNQQLDRPQEALKSLEEIASNSPDGFYAPLSLLLKAKILSEDLGKEQEAGQVYKEIMENYEDSLVSEEARQRLRALGVS